jgi:hypothetical protein
MPFPIRIAGLAVAAAFVTAAHAAEVPTLDVNRTCRPLGNDLDIQLDTERCLKTEREARDQLAKEWASFSGRDQSLCTQTASMGGLPSYVQLLTCLEMKRDVAKLPADHSLMTRPSSLPAK